MTFKNGQLEKKFVKAYSDWGFTNHPAIPHIIDPDGSSNAPTFVPATISTFRKKVTETGSIPNNGLFTMQDCLRTQTLSRDKNISTSEAYTWSSFFRMLGTLNDNEIQPSFYPWIFLTQVLGIPPRNIRIDVSSEYLSQFDIPQEQKQSLAIDMREKAKYDWTFGSDWEDGDQIISLVGIGLTILILDQKNDQFNAIGNVIILKHLFQKTQQSSTIGSEFAIGTGTTNFAINPNNNPPRLLGIQEAIINMGISEEMSVEDLKFFNALATALSLIEYGISYNNYQELSMKLKTLYPHLNAKTLNKKCKDAISLYRKSLKIVAIKCKPNQDKKFFEEIATKLNTYLFGNKPQAITSLLKDIDILRNEYMKACEKFANYCKKMKGEKTIQEIKVVGLNNGILASDIEKILTN